MQDVAKYVSLSMCTSDAESATDIFYLESIDAATVFERRVVEYKQQSFWKQNVGIDSGL